MGDAKASSAVGTDNKAVSVPVIMKMSVPAIVNNVAAPLAAALQLSFLGHSGGASAVAAYSAINAVVSFVINISNFLVVVVMSRVAHALGRQQWSLLGAAVRAALLTATAIGCSSAILLWLLRAFVFDLMSLRTHDIRELAQGYMPSALLRLPAMMVLKAASSVLCGYQHVRVASVLNGLLAVADVLAFYVTLFPLEMGLPVAGAAAAGSCYATAVAGLLMVVRKTPSEARRVVVCCPVREDDAPEPVGEQASILSLAYDSLNILIRSILLSGSVFSMSIAAAAQGAASLAAHAVLMQLWMVTSYVVDGFADVGTMLGGRLLGERNAVLFDRLVSRLSALSLACGVAAGAAIWLSRTALAAAFTEDAETLELLRPLWPLLCLLQPCNAIVFVYDGILYATQSFGYVRNALALGVCCVYAPLLLVAVHVQHDLLSLWLAKAALNAWRAATSLAKVHIFGSHLQAAAATSAMV